MRAVFRVVMRMSCSIFMSMLNCVMPMSVIGRIITMCVSVNVFTTIFVRVRVCVLIRMFVVVSIGIIRIVKVRVRRSIFVRMFVFMMCVIVTIRALAVRMVVNVFTSIYVRVSMTMHLPVMFVIVIF